MLRLSSTLTTDAKRWLCIFLSLLCSTAGRASKLRLNNAAGCNQLSYVGLVDLKDRMTVPDERTTSFDTCRHVYG
jgi:hypothetical protein